MAKTLRMQRTDQLLSTRRLAELAGTSNKTIVQLENGRQTPTFATIEKISRALGVEPRTVIEFAQALDKRAGVVTMDEPVANSVHLRRPHVLCVGQANVCLSLARRLVDTGQYGVTSMLGVPASFEQIACLHPDVLVLDMDSESPRPLELLKRLRLDPVTARTPVVATGSARERIRILATEPDGVVERTIIAPNGRDQHELVAAIEQLGDALGRDDESTMGNTLGNRKKGTP